MNESPKTSVYQKSLDEHLKNDQYKYSILLNLRDHEHKVLWQKFNVFLGFNTILIAVIAAVISLHKDSNTVPDSGLTYGLPFEVFLLFTCIFFIAYLSSIFLFNILKGSNFWITFWETKLTSSEVIISTDANPLINIFGDHASRVIQKIKERIKLLTKLDEEQKINPNDNVSEQICQLKQEISDLQIKLKDAMEKGYISTRNSMVYLVKIIMSIWGVFFIISATLTLYSLHLINDIYVGIGCTFFIGLSWIFYWYFTIKKNENEMNELLNIKLQEPVDNDKN